MKGVISCLFVAAAGTLVISSGDTCAQAANSGAEQWTRFEEAFVSSRDYDNPAQDVEVRVEFTSPSGNKRTFLAFWDGG
ncbi:MAG: DUF5060 domain-containing protein, partial [Planctomycetota bacterium]